PATVMPPRYIPPAGSAAKTAVVMVASGGDSPLAVRSDDISAAPLNITAGDLPVVLFRDKTDGHVKAFDRRIEKDLIPQFALNHEPRRKNAYMIDSDTNTGWSAAGVGVDGPDKSFRGHKLAPLDVQEDVWWGPVSFWYPKLRVVTK